VDSHNLFMTPTTYRTLRLEFAVAMIASGVALLAHWNQINWPAFIALFSYIDIIGYIPGAIAWRRNHGRLDTRVYHVLYNATHNFLTAGAVAGIWMLARGPEWALLALPLHLCGDRALFGNILEPFGLSFEPQVHPAYQEFVNRYDADRQPDLVADRHGARPAASHAA
jgi:hypothetical protein